MQYESEIQKALSAINKDGGIITVPTDTTYGLICKVGDLKAVDRIYEIKRRDISKPLIILGGKAESLWRWTKQQNAALMLLAEKFWPGPLTLVVQASDLVPKEIMAGKCTIGLRVPNHPICQSLLNQLPSGSAASTSANLSGAGAPKTIADVRNQIGLQVDYILEDCGQSPNGTESTVLDISGPTPNVLRAGELNSDLILEALRNP
jgi:L-threonylcarbamoyladenylate synthase